MGNNIVTGIRGVIINYINRIIIHENDTFEFYIVSLNQNSISLEQTRRCKKIEIIRSDNTGDNFIMKRVYKN